MLGACRLEHPVQFLRGSVTFRLPSVEQLHIQVDGDGRIGNVVESGGAHQAVAGHKTNPNGIVGIAHT